MILKNELVSEAISKNKLIEKLLSSKENPLLDDYVIVDYVTSEKIPEIKINGISVKSPPELFFKNYQYIYGCEVDNILKAEGSEFTELYNNERVFPHEFIVHFFDTFLVIDILPNSKDTEYLVLTPFRDKGIVAKNMPGMAAGIAIQGLFHALVSNPATQIALYIKTDKILEYLRSGLGKRKLFGTF